MAERVDVGAKEVSPNERAEKRKREPQTKTERNRTERGEPAAEKKERGKLVFRF